MSTNKKALRADALLFIVAIVWGTGFIVVKDTLHDISPLFLLAIRFTLSTIILSVIFYRKIKLLKMTDLKAGFIIGFCLFGGYALQTVGLKYTSPSNSGFLTATNVVIVPFIVWLIYREPPKINVFIASFLTLMGIGLISLNISLSIGLGDFLTILGAVFFASHVVSVGKYTKKIDAVVLTFSQFLFASVLFILSAFTLETVPTTINSKVTYSILYQVVIITIIGYLIQNYAQKHTSSSHTSIILSMEALFAMILDVVFLNGALSYRMIGGGALILIAVLIIELNYFDNTNKI